jgi:hypothetical protein
LRRGDEFNLQVIEQVVEFTGLAGVVGGDEELFHDPFLPHTPQKIAGQVARRGQRILLILLFDLFDCPSCMFADHWFFVVQGVLQDGEGVHVTGIAERNGDIAQVAASLGALNGSPLEALIEGLGCER